jgi:hypothetical protein
VSVEVVAAAAVADFAVAAAACEDPASSVISDQ